MLKVYLCGPLHLHGPLTCICIGPFRFRMALLRLYRTFHYHMGPFHPVRPSLVGGGVSSETVWSFITGTMKRNNCVSQGKRAALIGVASSIIVVVGTY